jgi:hypothetical protein
MRKNEKENLFGIPASPISFLSNNLNAFESLQEILCHKSQFTEDEGYFSMEIQGDIYIVS